MATIIQYMDDPKPADTKRVIDANLTSMAVGDTVMRSGNSEPYTVFMVAPLGGDIYVYCNPATGEYSKAQIFKPGDRVELHPSMDLWMRGAKYATVVRQNQYGVVIARSDSKRVRNLIRKTADHFRPVK